MKILALACLAATATAVVVTANYQVSQPPFLDALPFAISTTPNANNIWTATQIVSQQSGPNSFAVQLAPGTPLDMRVITDVAVYFAGTGYNNPCWIRDAGTGNVLWQMHLDGYGQAQAHFSTPLPLSSGTAGLLVEVGDAYNFSTFSAQSGPIDGRISLVGRYVRTN